MGHKFAELAFTPSVRGVQEQMGSRRAYARWEGGPDVNGAFGPDEAAFIEERDAFFLATVSETGWPYVQHRGGPAGFVRVLDDRTIGFADLRGNRQYVSAGNVLHDDRVSLVFLDWAQPTRLKVLGRARLVAPEERELFELLRAPHAGARAERGVVVRVEAFDWNCPQHITPRFTLAEVERATAGLRARVAELDARLGQAGLARRDGSES
jgi:uncharacterized protein